MASISIEFDKATDPPGSETVSPDIPHFNTEEEFYAYLRGEAIGVEDESTTGEDDGLSSGEGDGQTVGEGDEVTTGGSDEPTSGEDDGIITSGTTDPTSVTSVKDDGVVIGGGEGVTIGEGNGLNSKGTCKKIIFEDVAVATNDIPAFAPFENTSPIISAHKKMWRGGHSNNILALAVGTKEQKVSYVTGLLVPSITLLSVFLFWMLVLLVLKRFGPDRVGFLSGRRAKLPPRQTGEADACEKDDDACEKDDADVVPNETETEKENEPEQSKDIDEQNSPDILVLKNDEWNALYAKKKKDEFWMKTVVVISCIFVIAMAITMAQKGVQSLRASLVDGKKSINYASNLLTRAEVVVTDLSTGIENFQTDVLDVLERTNTGLCPTLRPEGFCQRVFDLESCDFTVEISYEKNITVDKLNIGTTVNAEYTHYVDASEVSDGIKDKIGLDGQLDLRELLFPGNVYSKTVNFFSSDWAIITRMNSLANILNSISALADNTGDQVGDIEWVLYIAVGFDVLVGVLAACIILDIVVGNKMPRYLKCIQRRCLFPFFMTCVVLSFIFAMVFLITSMALSDVCIDGPNQRVLSLAEWYTEEGTLAADVAAEAAEYVSGFLKHWFSQCKKEPVIIEDDQAFLDEAQLNLEAFESAILSVTDTVTEFCGTPDQELFADSIATSSNFICALFGLLLNVREALECRTWMPLYYNTLYNALCYNGIDGFWSIAATQFTVVLMACIILTFRAVFLDLEIAEIDDVETVGAGEKNKVLEVSASSNAGHVLT